MNLIQILIKKNKILRDFKIAKNLPNFIETNTLDFYSIYFPKMEKPNKIIYYYEYPKLNESFFEVNNKVSLLCLF